MPAELPALTVELPEAAGKLSASCIVLLALLPLLLLPLLPLLLPLLPASRRRPRLLLLMDSSSSMPSSTSVVSTAARADVTLLTPLWPLPLKRSCQDPPSEGVHKKYSINAATPKEVCRVSCKKSCIAGSTGPVKSRLLFCRLKLRHAATMLGPTSAMCVLLATLSSPLT